MAASMAASSAAATSTPEIGETAGVQKGLGSPYVLHTGDIVLLKTQLKDEVFAEAGEVPDDTGYVCARGLDGKVSVVRQEYPLEDVRAFLFIVVDQLSYFAQRDLQRRRKHMAQSLDGKLVAGSVAELHLQTYEKRAVIEAKQNVGRLTARPRPLLYGDIVQLQHLRTGKYVAIEGKMAATLQKTSRLVELQGGSTSCALRINPHFKHRNQGEPVTLGEQTSLECIKLGAPWSLNWAECTTMGGDTVYEVNCATQCRGFYFELYNRPMAGTEFRFGVGSAVRLYHPHYSGFVSASCKIQKNRPFLRRPHVADEPSAVEMMSGADNYNSKDIWIIEPGGLDRFPAGIEWYRTPVQLRHLGSGRYLSVCREELQRRHRMDRTVPLAGGDSAAGPGQQKPPPLLVEHDLSQDTDPFAVELLDAPDECSIFTMDPMSALVEAESHDKKFMDLSDDSAVIMLVWEGSPRCEPLWLSCQGAPKGSKHSLQMCWSITMYSRDAIRLDLRLGEKQWLAESEAVCEHKMALYKEMIPRCKDFSNMRVAALVCAQIERALSDMIYFLSGSGFWRSPDRNEERDALEVPWTTHPNRQRIVREMKYMDASFELFHELVKQTPTIIEGDFRRGRRIENLNLALLLPSSVLAAADRRKQEDKLLLEMVLGMKTRCLKLLVRFWLFGFLGSHENSIYFYRKGWVETLNSLNGYGLGSANVFVALLSDNTALVRRVGPAILQKFIEFIRLLGPLDTWLSFLTALCAPQGSAIGTKQQSVLTLLVSAGNHASDEDKLTATKNRNELLVRFKMGHPINVPIGRPLSGRRPAPLEECMAHTVLVDGVHDVAISWAHPDYWSVGNGVLYHGPEALGLPVIHSLADDDDPRVWVSLAQVCWVLQPDQCCEAATGNCWADVQRAEGVEGSWTQDVCVTDTLGFQGSKIGQLRTLAMYVLAQLQLVASLAKERQMNCVMSLQDDYPFSLCVCGASDPRLPTSVRAAFFDLLTDLWLDRHPHTQVICPALMRAIPEVDEQVGEELPSFKLHTEVPVEVWSQEHLLRLHPEVHSFHKLGQAYKMEALTWTARAYLGAGPEIEQQIHNAHLDNKLTLAVLRLLAHLYRFGFIHNVELLDDLLGSCLRCLDGRTDKLAPVQGNNQKSEDGVTEVLVERPSVMGRGRHSIAVPEPLVPLLSNLPPEGTGLARGPPRLTKVDFPPLADSETRYLKCDENRLVFDSKIELLRIVLQSLSMSLHIKITHVLHHFRKLTAQGDTQDAAYYVKAIVKELDEPTISLSQRGIHVPSVMCVDLLMYDDPTIFALALEVLVNNCCQTVELMDMLEKIELLTPTQSELFHAIRADVMTLDRLIYSFENWGVDDQFSTSDTSKFVMLQRICQKLKALCAMGVPEVSTTRHEIQKMLHETEFFSLVHCVLKWNIHDVPVGSRPLMLKVKASICSAAVQFVAQNQKNQALAFGAIQDMTPLLDTLPESVQLLAETFRDNMDLCSQVPASLVNRFGELIASERSAGKLTPWYLEFFRAIVAVGRENLPRNQQLVVETIQRLTPAKTVHVLTDESTMGWRRVMELGEQFTAHDQLRFIDVSTWDAVSAGDAELIYYVRSVELLIGLAKGSGAQRLLNRPYVNSLFPAQIVIILLTHISSNDDLFLLGERSTIQRYLCTRYLQLLHVLIYEVDASLINTELLCTPMHVELLERLLDWTEITLKLKENLPRSDADIPFLSEEQEEFADAILSCVDSFFDGPYPLLEKRNRVHDVFARSVQRFKARFAVLATTSGRPLMPVKLRRPEKLQVAAHRVINATTLNKSRGLWSNTAPSQNLGTTAMEMQWRQMLECVQTNETFKRRIKEEDRRLAYIVARIPRLTDPDDADYRSKFPTQALQSLPEGVDFRRNHISTVQVLRRFVEHCKPRMHSDVSSLKRVQKILLAMLESARDSPDPKVLEKLQATFVDANIHILIIHMLHERVSFETTETAWTLLAGILQGAGHGQLVNRHVQQAMLQSMDGTDDAGMWESFREILSSVWNHCKTVRKIEALSSHTWEEKERIAEYTAAVNYAIRGMEGLRLMVEGHYHPMQEYFYSQTGNLRSCNVPELAAMLLMRLCKSSDAADVLSEEELACVSKAVNLITELSQGPNYRNQWFFSTLGLIETIFRLLGAHFERAQKSEGDLYPPKIRQIKALFAETLLSLLEGRLDVALHKTMLQRADTAVLKQRIQFVYLYFVFGALGVSSRSVSSSGSMAHASAAVPLDSDFSEVVSLKLDATRVYNQLAPASRVAEELLEDLEDAELDELFSEGLSILELIFMLSPHSDVFKSEMIPGKEPEVFDETKYGTEKALARARAGYHRREIYRLSYEHLSRFVRTIEVVLNGQIQYLHFQQPLTALWYVHGATQQHILDSVDMGSPETKMKMFVEMCTEAHKESKHIRTLSRYSLVPDRYLKIAQRYLPDAAHRPFQLWLVQDAWMMTQLLNMSLVLSFALCALVGLFLTDQNPDGDEDDGGRGGNYEQSLYWTSVYLESACLAMGALYFLCSLLWVLLTACIKVPLRLQARQSVHKFFLRAVAQAVKDLFMDLSFSWRVVLLVACGFALVARRYTIFTVSLLDLFCQVPVLATILNAMTTPAKSLLMTFLGTTIVTFLYAAIGFHNFRSEFHANCSPNIIMCTNNILYQGTRGGIVGLSGMMDLVMPDDGEFTVRALYDSSYFMIIGVFILNTIVALIVDSFIVLRKDHEERQRLLRTQTFISCLDRNTIDGVAQTQGQSDGFEYHESVRQNKWNYMAFIFHLREKDVLDYTGPEQTIRQMIQNGDVKWLPLGRSLWLEESEIQATGLDVLARIEKTTAELANAMEAAQQNRNLMVTALKGLDTQVRERFEAVQLMLQDFSTMGLGSSPGGPARNRSRANMNHSRTNLY